MSVTTVQGTASAASSGPRQVTLHAASAPKASPQPTGLPTLEDGYGATPQQKAAMAQASAQARRSGKPVVVDGLTTETQQVLAQPKGGFTLAGNPEPVRTEQHGAWVPVDLTLRRIAGGFVAPAATAYGTVTFSGGGRGPLVTTTSGATSFSLSWPSALPTPTIAGSAATYADVLPGVDLRVSATRAGGFSDVLVVKTRQAAENPALASLRLAMATAGGKAASGGNDNVLVTGKAGGNTLVAATPMMWDSNTTPSVPAGNHASSPRAGADPSDAAHPGLTAHVAQVTTHTSGHELDLGTDRHLLTTGVLPIYIDPSFNWHPTTGGTPAFDEVKQGSPCPNTSFFDQTGVDGDYGELGVGYNNWNSCIGVERAFYQWQLPSVIWGAHIGNVSGQPGATVNVTKVMSSACVTSPAYLYWSGGIGPGTSWNSQPGLIGQIGGANVGHTGSCPGYGTTVSAGFDVTGQIAQSAANHSSQFTVGLLGNESPGNIAFSRYGDNPTLQIFYNLAPNTPGPNQMSASSGAENAGCATSTPYPYMGKTLATNTPELTADVSDPDGDNLQATFKYWVQGLPNQYTGTSADNLASGSNAQFSLPPSFVASLSNGQEVDWQTQVSDGEDASGWSAICHFIAEPTAPSAPSITSADGRYPNNGKVGAPVGTPGRFTFASTGGIVSKLVQNMDQAPSTTNPPASQVAPFNGGGVINAAGRWKLADGSGTSAADSVGGHPAKLTGGAGWVNDPARGEVLSLDGSTGYASTTAPVINTSGSFTVSAWVKPTSLANGFDVLGQDSVFATGFYLEYILSDGKWSFSRLATDTLNAPAIRAESTNPAQAGVWTHLVGEYDDATGTLSLYVNGQAQGTAIDSTPYTAAGPFTIGRGQWNALSGGYVPGLISDVQAYQAALSPSDIAQVYAGNDGPAGRWKLADGSGTNAADSAGSHAATLNGGAGWTSDASRGKVLSLDGSSGYAATSGPALNTAGSFTVSAWVDPTSMPAGNGGIVSADGANSSAFYLYIASGCNCWAFGVSPSDSPSVNLPAAIGLGANLNTWTHLVGVYNATTQTEKLFVNGKQTATVSNVTAWNASGALAIGRYKWSGQNSGYFPGEISDVQTYQAALTPTDIARIYSAASAGPSAVIAPNGRWHLLEGNGSSAVDSSGGNNPAAFHGAATWWAPNTDSPAVQFDGSTGYLATSGPVVNTAGSFTVSAWVDPAVADGMAVLGQDGDRESAFYLEYIQPDNKWSFSRLTSDDTQAIRAESINAPQTGAWTHLVGTYDASTGAMTLYVNGQAQSTQSDTTPYNGTGAFTIGRARSAGAPAGYFNGAISDVQTYPTALDASEVAQIDSSSTLALTPPSPGPHTLYAYAADNTGDTSGYQSYDFVAGQDPVTPCASLAACFNNTAVSPDSNMSMGNADGSQQSIPADDLKAAGWNSGGQVTINGATFTLPQFGAGQADNVLAANQKVAYNYPVSPVGASALEFLATATTASTAAPGSINGDTTAPYVPAGTAVAGSYCFDSTNPAAWCAPRGTITYTDGSTQNYDLTVPDWITGPATLAALSLPHENAPDGQNSNQPKLYPFSVPLLPGKTVASVTLPDVGTSVAGGHQALHIFGMATRNTTVEGAPARQTWTGTWGAPTEGLFNNGAAFSNVTMREVVKPSVSGSTVRIKFDDALGADPLSIGHATIALDSGNGSPSPIPAGTFKSLTFGGSQSVTIPEGGMVYSDPISFAVPANQYMLVSFQLANTVQQVVSHSASNSTGVEFVTGNGAGDQTTDTTGTPFSTNGGFGSQSTSVVTDVDVATAGTPTEAVIGDGYIDQAQTIKLPTASNNLAAVLTATDATTPNPYGIVAEGIESNQVMTDYPESHGSNGLSGPALLSRIDRDILDQPGLSTVIIDEGLEDVLGGRSASDLTANGYTTLVDYLQNSGINIVATGLTPCDGYAGDGATPNDTCTAAVDKQRVAANTFLAGHPNSLSPYTTPSYFYIDSDRAIGDPDSGNGEIKLNPAADAGDHVNLTDAGFAALGTALLGAQDSWPLNDGGTSTSATDNADNSTPYLTNNPAAGNNPAGLTGGATWAGDASRGEVLSLDGTTGYASTGGPVLNTAGSYSVSAWVNLSSTTAPSAAIGQDGSTTSAFQLGYDSSTGRWDFDLSTADATNPIGVEVSSTSAPATGTWTHLVGVHDANAKTISLYVNGVLQQSAPDTTAWNATGPLTIGRIRLNGANNWFFPGEISDAQAWNYALTATQISALYQQVN